MDGSDGQSGEGVAELGPGIDVEQFAGGGETGQGGEDLASAIGPEGYPVRSFFGELCRPGRLLICHCRVWGGADTGEQEARQRHLRNLERWIGQVTA